MFKKQSANKGKNDFWISFSDLMTGLMLVFIVLSLTFMAIIQKNMEDMENNKKNIIIILQKALNAKGIDLKYNQEKGTVTISERILFTIGKSELNKKGKNFIRFFSEIIDQEIFNKKEYKNLIKYLHIEGYGSKSGSENRNFDLSFERAKNVWYEMVYNSNIQNKKIMRHKLDIISKGEIEANQRIDLEADRKVVFRFEFYDLYDKILKPMSKIGKLKEWKN
jgi:outer membrane protein OmpA-like peptidoglycan-associated protein